MSVDTAHADSKTQEQGLHLQDMHEGLLEEVLRIENLAQAHPWSRGNFRDALAAAYLAQCLFRQDQLLAYYVVLPGLQEMHLLNIVVSPAFQNQGLAQVLLQALAGHARQQNCEAIWLELRQSNTRALRAYERFGFKRVGVRKHYYPLLNRQREDAILMNFELPSHV